MTIHNDYTAQIFYSERLAKLSAEAAADHLVRTLSRRPRGRPTRRPWWWGLGRSQRRTSPLAA